MADHEIRIAPKVDFTDLNQMSRRLQQMEAQFDRLAQSAAKVKVPTGSDAAGGGSGPSADGGARRPAGGPGMATPRYSAAESQAAKTMPNIQQRARKVRGGGAPGQSASTPGGLLNWMMSVFLPDQPTIQQMTQPLGSHLTPKARQALPTFRYNPKAWKSPPQTQAEYEAIGQQVYSQPGLSPAQQKAAMDAAVGGYTPITPAGAAQSTTAMKQALFQARSGGGGGSGTGGTTRGRTVKTLMSAAGLGVLSEMGPLALAAAGVGFVGTQVRQGWSTYHTQGTAFSALSKSLGDLGQSFNTLRDVVNKTGLNFAETLPQITQVMQTMSPIPGTSAIGGSRECSRPRKVSPSAMASIR